MQRWIHNGCVFWAAVGRGSRDCSTTGVGVESGTRGALPNFWDQSDEMDHELGKSGVRGEEIVQKGVLQERDAGALILDVGLRYMSWCISREQELPYDKGSTEQNQSSQHKELEASSPWAELERGGDSTRLNVRSKRALRVIETDMLKSMPTYPGVRRRHGGLYERWKKL